MHVLKRLGGGGGILPSNKLTGMCRGMGFHFHAWIEHNGVSFFKILNACFKETWRGRGGYFLAIS